MSAGEISFKGIFFGLFGLFILGGIIWVIYGGPTQYATGPNGATSTVTAHASTTATTTKVSLWGVLFPKFEARIVDSPATSEDYESSSRSRRGTDRSLLSDTSTGIKVADSPYRGMVRINPGSASSGNSNADKEYIILSASSNNKNPIIISGWKLLNGKSQRTFMNGVKVTSDIVSLPLGAPVFYGYQPSPVGLIVLNPGDRAYVITGRIPIATPYPYTVSFRLNKCSGYLADQAILNKTTRYSFTPGFPAQCPDPEKMVDISSLDDDCYRFVRSLGSCRMPVFDLDNAGYTLLNNSRTNLSSRCINMIKTTFNYRHCVETYKNDADFAAQEWRIFLNRPPLWSRDREIITLLDERNKVVDQYTYGY